MTDVCELIQAGDASARTRERGIAELADRQHGVVARFQLMDIGLGRGGIDHRVRTGRLHRLHLGVYAVGHRQVSLAGRSLAAVLACGPTALLSHRSAAARWGIAPGSSQRMDVTTAGAGHGRPGIALHRSRRIHAEDRAVMSAIPITSVARTLLDLAEVVKDRQLQRAIDEAERRELFDLRAVERLVARSYGRRGLSALNRALAAYRIPEFTRSELERRFLDVCREAGLPPPATNLFVAGAEVDMVWPGHRLVVELDGHAYHRTLASFEEDRSRDARLQLAGFRVVRITFPRLIGNRMWWSR